MLRTYLLSPAHTFTCIKFVVYLIKVASTGAMPLFKNSLYFTVRTTKSLHSKPLKNIMAHPMNIATHRLNCPKGLGFNSLKFTIPPFKDFWIQQTLDSTILVFNHKKDSQHSLSILLGFSNPWIQHPLESTPFDSETL